MQLTSLLDGLSSQDRPLVYTRVFQELEALAEQPDSATQLFLHGVDSHILNNAARTALSDSESAEPTTQSAAIKFLGVLLAQPSVTVHLTPAVFEAVLLQWIRLMEQAPTGAAALALWSTAFVHVPEALANVVVHVTPKVAAAVSSFAQSVPSPQSLAVHVLACLEWLAEHSRAWMSAHVPQWAGLAVPHVVSEVEEARVAASRLLTLVETEAWLSVGGEALVVEDWVATKGVSALRERVRVANFELALADIWGFFAIVLGKRIVAHYEQEEKCEKSGKRKVREDIGVVENFLGIWRDMYVSGFPGLREAAMNAWEKLAEVWIWFCSAWYKRSRLRVLTKPISSGLLSGSSDSKTKYSCTIVWRRIIERIACKMRLVQNVTDPDKMVQVLVCDIIQDIKSTGDMSLWPNLFGGIQAAVSGTLLDSAQDSTEKLLAFVISSISLLDQMPIDSEMLLRQCLSACSEVLSKQIPNSELPVKILDELVPLSRETSQKSVNILIDEISLKWKVSQDPWFVWLLSKTKLDQDIDIEASILGQLCRKCVIEGVSEVSIFIFCFSLFIHTSIFASRNPKPLSVF